VTLSKQSILMSGLRKYLFWLFCICCCQCNNPLTKEAKLTAAMRIVSEWKDYDLEVKKLQNNLNRNQTDEEGDLKSRESTVRKAGE